MQRLAYTPGNAVVGFAPPPRLLLDPIDGFIIIMHRGSSKMFSGFEMGGRTTASLDNV